MSDFDILNKQITSQIIGRYTIDMKFKNVDSDLMDLYVQDEKYYLRPVFKSPHEITKEEFEEIMACVEDAAIEQVRSSKGTTALSYDEFFNKYFNGRY